MSGDCKMERTIFLDSENRQYKTTTILNFFNIPTAISERIAFIFSIKVLLPSIKETNINFHDSLLVEYLLMFYIYCKCCNVTKP